MRGWNSDNFSDNYVVRASCLLSLNLDIVGVVETHLKNDETLEVAGYEWFGQNGKRLHVKPDVAQVALVFSLKTLF